MEAGRDGPRGAVGQTLGGRWAMRLSCAPLERLARLHAAPKGLVSRGGSTEEWR
jgi:hypothetical protein